MKFYNDPRAVVATLNAVWEANDLDTTIALFAEDAVLIVHASSAGAPHAGRWEGRENIRNALIGLRVVFEYILYRPRIVSCTGDRVYVTVEFMANHRATGERIELRFRQEFTVQNGRITRCDEFHDAAKLEAFMRLLTSRSGKSAFDRGEPDRGA